MPFSTGERTDWRISFDGETIFEFINRSAWPVCGMIRNLYNIIEEPFQHDSEFQARLRSVEYKQHAGAVLELLFFSVLQKSGLNIQRLARVQGTATPDFVIIQPGKPAVILETTLAQSALDNEATNRRIAAVKVILETKLNFGYYVFMDYRTVSESSISKKHFCAFLDKMVEQYPHGADIGPEATYSGEGWVIDCRLIKKTLADSQTNQAVEYHGAKFIDNYKPLFTSLNDKKPAKYQIGTQPYVIVVGIDDLTVSDTEYSEVLFGLQPSRDINRDFASQGFWLRNGEPINTSVSAVIFCKWLKLFHLEDTEIMVWNNPFATMPLDKTLFSFPQVWFDGKGSRLQRRDAGMEMDMLTTLGVDADLYRKYKRYDFRRAPK